MTLPARRTTCAALALAAIAALAPAAAQADYVGGAAIYNPVDCPWPTQVEMAMARYTPAGSDGHRTSEVVLHLAVGGVQVFQVQGDMNPSSVWRTARGNNVWGRLYTMSPAPQLRIAERRGINWTGDWPDARDIRMRMHVRNFNGHRGCQVTVALMLTRRRY